MKIKERLIDILSKYFELSDTYCYHLTRVKEGFSYGTVTLEDFVEFDDATIDDLADDIIKNNSTRFREDTNYEMTWWFCEQCKEEYLWDSPKETNLNYCPGCGRAIIEFVDYKDPWKDEDDVEASYIQDAFKRIGEHGLLTCEIADAIQRTYKVPFDLCIGASEFADFVWAASKAE